MSNESPKRIERMLRKWARNRRAAAGAGWPVHPATRRLLQGEVARTFGAARVAAGGAGGGARGWLGWSWVRLALSGGAVAAVLVGVWVWWPGASPKVGELAQAPVVPGERTDRADRPAPGLAAAKVPADAAKKADKALVDNPSGAAAPLPTATLEFAPSAVKQSVSFAKADGLADSKETTAGALADGEAKSILAARAKAVAELPTRAEIEKLKVVSRDEAPALLAKAKDASEVVSGKTATAAEGVVAGRNRAMAEKSEVRADFEVKDLRSAVPLAAAPRPTVVYSAPPAALAPPAPPPATAAPMIARGGPAAARPASALGLDERFEANGLARVAKPAGAPGLPTEPAKALDAAVASAPAPALAGVPLASRLVEAEAQVGQQNFLRVNAANLYRRNLQSPPAPAVLNQFQLQRAGEMVTVVDEDGSVYSGQVITAEPAGGRASGMARALGVTDRAAATPTRLGDLPEAAKRERAPVAEALRREQDKGGAEPNGYWFRAVGTNRSVNQRVVFTGEFLPNGAPVADGTGEAPGTIQKGLAPTAGSGGKGGQLFYSAPTSGAQQGGGAGAAQGRVNGRVRVGLSNDIQVEAVSPGSQRR